MKVKIDATRKGVVTVTGRAVVPGGYQLVGTSSRDSSPEGTPLRELVRGAVSSWEEKRRAVQDTAGKLGVGA